ncbi:DUF930 domain-containing protein, partial [Rhizobium ruizarguesonis]
NNGGKPEKGMDETVKDQSPGEKSRDAPGAVCRSKGDWYHLAYNCITGPQQINVRERSYEIGEKVPREKWDKYDLED